VSDLGGASLLGMLRAGTAELARLARARELRPEHWVWAVRGAGAYAAAYARGDRARPELVERRRAACGACERLTPRAIRVRDPSPVARQPVRRGVDAIAWYCGEPLIDRRADRGPGGGTCGCLVGLTVMGEGHTAAGPPGRKGVRSERHQEHEGDPLTRAAGKPLVASEACPLGRWPESDAAEDDSEERDA